MMREGVCENCKEGEVSLPGMTVKNLDGSVSASNVWIRFFGKEVFASNEATDRLDHNMALGTRQVVYKLPDGRYRIVTGEANFSGHNDVEEEPKSERPIFNRFGEVKGYAMETYSRYAVDDVAEFKPDEVTVELTKEEAHAYVGDTKLTRKW